MEFWNNLLPDMLKNLPPNEYPRPSVDRPEILPPEESFPMRSPYYPVRKVEHPWPRLPPLIPTQSPSVFGTIITSENEKSRPSSPGLLGVDGTFGSRVVQPGNPPPVQEPPPDVEIGNSSSMAMSIVIVIGVCLLLVNLCAFAGLYYQRDRLKIQERLMKKRYEDVEPTNNEDIYMNQRKDGDDDAKNPNSLEMTMQKNTLKKKKQQSNDEIYEAVRSRTLDGKDVVMEDDDIGESSFKRWRLSRQCSASTMDPHTKVREWIAHEIVQRCSPRFLRRTKFQLQQQQLNRPVLQKDNSFDTSIDLPSSAVILPIENREPNPSSPALSKPTTSTTLQRSRVKKVSVAVDATPAARSASVLKQIPIEQSKSMEELGGERCISTSEIILEQQKPPLKRSETCRESLARSSSSPVSEHSQQRDTVLRRSTTSVNLKMCQPILKKTNNGLPIVHGHSKSDPVPNTNNLQEMPQQNMTQSMCPHLYNIPVDSKGWPHAQGGVVGMSKKPLKTFPTSGTHVKLKLHTPKKDIGITASPVSNRSKDINVTSRDSTINIEEKSLVDPLKNIQRRKFPKVLPDLPPGQDIILHHEKSIDEDRELTPVQAIAAKRRSLPPPTNLLVGLLPPSDDNASLSQPTTPTGGYHKDTQTQIGKVPPPPPPRISSTLGRKPNNSYPVKQIETNQDSAKLKSPVLSPNYQQRPEPRVIIKPTSTTPVTRNPSLAQQSRTKQQIPRVIPNTGEDYPLTPTALHHQFSQPSSPNPRPSLSRQSSVRSQQELPVTPTSQTKSTGQPQVHKSDMSTSTPPLQNKLQKSATKKSTESSTSTHLPLEDTSSNTGTVKRAKKNNPPPGDSSEVATTQVGKGSTVPKAWYAQYNQSFLSKTKDSDK